MRLYRFLIILFLIFSLTAYGKSNENTVTISGHYYGKNLIVKNPFAASGIGFSIYKVQVNNTLTSDQINSNIFEIHLENIDGLKFGDKIDVIIWFKDDTSPVFLNSSVVKESNIKSIPSINGDGINTGYHIEDNSLCLIKGIISYERDKHLSDSALPYGFSNSISVLNMVEDDTIESFSSKAYEYIFTANFGGVSEISLNHYEKSTKSSMLLRKIIIDLRGVPLEYRKGQFISLETNIEDIQDDRLSDLYSKFPSKKLIYSPVKQQLMWDEDYENALLSSYNSLLGQIDKEKQQIIEKAASDRQLIIEQEKKEKQKVISYAIGGGLVLVLGFLLFVFNRLRVTRNQKVVIENQRDKVNIQKTEIEEQHKEIKDSMEYAKRIQSAILPPSKLVKEYLQQSFILYKPKDIVAGDFYWMEHIGGKVLFAAADCTGHGVPGAMVSVICNGALNRSVREFELSEPGKILDKAREIVIQEFEKSEEEVKDGMDIALCSLEGMKLEYAGAHNPLWIVRKGEIIETKANKQPIGKFDKQTGYITHSFDLEVGDTIYIFSDGYVDQFGGEKGKKFKAKAFRNLLLSIQEKSMEEQKILIDDAFEAWRGSLEQIDDVCVIGVRV